MISLHFEEESMKKVRVLMVLPKEQSIIGYWGLN